MHYSDDFAEQASDSDTRCTEKQCRLGKNQVQDHNGVHDFNVEIEASRQSLIPTSPRREASHRPT